MGTYPGCAARPGELHPHLDGVEWLAAQLASGGGMSTDPFNTSAIWRTYRFHGACHPTSGYVDCKPDWLLFVVSGHGRRGYDKEMKVRGGGDSTCINGEALYSSGMINVQTFITPHDFDESACQIRRHHHQVNM